MTQRGCNTATTPTFLLNSGSEVTRMTLINGNQRIEVTARDVWAAFSSRSFTAPCIKCYDHGGQCTRNYPAGCRGNK